MFGTGSCRQPPPAFHAWSATANMAICTQRGSSSSPKRLSRSTASCASIGCEPFLFGAHLPQHRERLDEEVTRAAARVHDRDLGDAVGPTVEGAGGGPAVVVEAEVLEALHERAVGMSCGPPRAEGVLEQEPDHVVLGEQLGHRPEVRAADLALRGVDLVLLVLLPELVHPAQRVVG